MNSSAQPTWQDIKTYCKDRLSEIREINSQFHCPSGFVCIAAFIAYLSRLAYGTNVKTDRHDGEWFKRFVLNFMPTKYHGHEDMLYKTFRCGILHSMSFDDEIDDNRTAYLVQHMGMTQGYAMMAISHDAQLGKLCTGPVLIKEPQTQMYVLVADVLCDDIEIAIEEMFKEAAVQRNSVEFECCQRRIQCIPLAQTQAQSKQGPIIIGLNAKGVMTNAPSLSSSF